MLDHLTTLAGRSQDTMARGARMWAESARRLSDPQGMPGPGVTAVVDVVFDLAEQVLATQRALTKAVLRILMP